MARERTSILYPKMELAHTRKTQEVLDHFGVDTEVGLDEERAIKDLAKYGLNGEATVLIKRMCAWYVRA